MTSILRLKLDILKLHTMVTSRKVKALDDGWITLNGGSGEDEDGGSHVFIGKGGKIEKGAGGLVGKKINELVGTKKFTTHETNAEREQAKQPTSETKPSEQTSNNLTKAENASTVSSTSQSEAETGESKMNAKPTTIKDGVEKFGKEKVMEYITDALLGNSKKAEQVFNGKIEPNDDVKRELGYLGIDLPEKTTLSKPEKTEKQIAAIEARAKALVEKAGQNKKDAQLHKNVIVDILERDRRAKGTTGSQAAKLSKSEEQFLKDIGTKDKLSEKQAKWMHDISSKFNIRYYAPDSVIKKTIVKKSKISNYQDEDEPDMPMQRADGSWYDAETGLDITNPKHMNSYL